jgi:aryl-alcohol dehydrogenase-like predicted oxidoreductase
VVATKGGWERCGPAQWLHNASPRHLTEAVEGSLKRLRLDRIDVYQLHVPDPAVSYDASMETLARLREQGKIRHVGLSNVTQEHVERGRKTATSTASPSYPGLPWDRTARRWKF